MLNRAIVGLAVMTSLLSFHSQCAACSMARCLNDGDEMRPTFTPSAASYSSRGDQVAVGGNGLELDLFN
jgi:hypothetical protein